MSAAKTSRLVGASAQSQAAMSSSMFRTLSTVDCATAGPIGRARALRPRQVLVRFQVRNASTWDRSKRASVVTSG